ncbi:leucine-rich repeat-containing protein 28-like [Planococcus citri]|uniref:leucine-rich repeat-containing protein 28-like n=1 Tax=Planococcus citri TaxID=170843 RepID=UPI0031FA16E2
MDDHIVKEIQKSFILHWNYRNLTNFPEELRYHGNHVEDLYLKGNFIAQVPTWIVEMKNLVELHLSGNNLNKLPEEISSLKSLQLIDVNQNRIKQLPKSFTDLKHLNHFFADDNQLSYLPCDIGRLKSLAILSVAKNNLRQIPDTISECVSLQELNLDHNELICLPKSIIYLPNLCYISLQNNNLQYLPNIPFYAEPTILIRNNDLTYLSYSFARYLKRKHVPPIEQVSDWNFHCARFNSRHELFNHTIIHSASDNTHVIPLQQIYSPVSINVPSLYEISLRVAYRLSYHIRDSQRICRDRSEMLPKVIKKDFVSGPTALCDSCNTLLYNYAIIKLYSIVHSSTNIELVNFFCKLSCAQKFSPNFRELPNLLPIDWILCEK